MQGIGMLSWLSPSLKLPASDPLGCSPANLNTGMRGQEVDLEIHADHIFIIDCIALDFHYEFSRRDLLRQSHCLGNIILALLHWALYIGVRLTCLFADIELLVEELDEAKLHCNVHVCTFLDDLMDVALDLYSQVLARLWRIWINFDRLYLDNLIKSTDCVLPAFSGMNWITQ